MTTSLSSVEVPRLLKKPGGERKRVNTHQELAEALADGWLVRLEDAPAARHPEPETEAIYDAAMEYKSGRSAKKK